MTDVERVENYLRGTQGAEFNHRRIVDDMRITEYSGRISDVRRKWGCTCGQDKTTCMAIEHVQNTRKGYYRYLCRKLTYEAEIKPVQIVKKATVMPEKCQKVQGEAAVKWESLRDKLGRKPYPVANY